MLKTFILIVLVLALAAMVVWNLIIRRDVKNLIAENKELKAYSFSDALTGLFNRRYFETFLPQAVALTRRQNIPLSIIAIDADNLKKINDHYGHDKGDEYLKGIADALMHAAQRQEDAAFRCGGDEFFLVLPGTDCKGTRIIIEGIRKRIELLQNEMQVDIPISVSIGVECICTECSNMCIGNKCIGGWVEYKNQRLTEVCATIKSRADFKMYIEKRERKVARA